MASRRKRLLWIAPLALLGLAAFIALGGWIVMTLWNWLLPAMFGWVHITFWQAVALLALCRILFGGFRLAGAPRRTFGHRMAQRWASMTPEEREKAREQFRRGQWGCAVPPEPPPTA
jgi:hypothetical protein